ncbi:MAG: VWA domain-containing protein [Acidobacteria bacterium]|nr:VWA domain-containing protein [Acidobacteriota bacterium]
MRYAAPEWLAWLWGLLILAVALVWLFIRRRRHARRFAQSPALRHVMLEEVSYLKKGLAYVLLFGVFSFTLLALARPQWGTRLENVVQRGVDVLIAVDTSLSMETPDVSPNRLAKAKEELIALIEQLEDARIGVITFAGTAFSQCPLTVDRTAARMFIEILDSGLIPEPGTNIARAVELARETFQKHQRKYKVLILITDGENLEGNPLEEVRGAADEGIIIHTIGIGTPSGQPIPIRDESGRIVDYKKNLAGEAVISRLDEGTLAEIAQIAGGRYFRATQAEEEVPAIIEEIQSMEKRELQSRMLRQYLERYQLPLLVAVLLLSVECLILDRKRTLRRTWRRLFRRRQENGNAGGRHLPATGESSTQDSAPAP